ncbi:MAG: TrbI/VirB10 family protein [Betaproteobacteria bacterium]|nr:TrbI/VirB10 family protein [Betaproteobacteria bacterium]
MSLAPKDWEESDQAYPLCAPGRVRRNLHWLVAGGLGLGVVVGFALQGTLLARAEAPHELPAQAEDNPLVLGQEPPQGTLRQELQREQQPDPESSPHAAPLALPSSKPLSEPVQAEQVRRFETEKQQALVAGSRMLAINRAADATLPPAAPATATPSPSGMPATPSVLGVRLPPGISPVPAGLALRETLPGRGTEGSGEAAHAKQARAQTPLLPMKPASTREVMEGSLIPAVLLTQVNSDLPGMLTAQVTEDVYDSIHGSFLAIPKGSRVIGEYSSRVMAGQERIMAVFHRLILPGGESFSLDDMQAADRSGQSGMKDEVDSRFWTRLGGQFMTAGLARIIAQPEGSVTVLGGMGNSLAADAAGQILVDTARVGFAANATLGPVIVIKRGYPFVIMVNRDMDFSTLGR